MKKHSQPAALSYLQLLDAAPDAMLVVDEGGNIVFANRQTELLFGYARSELIDSPVEMLLPERLRTRHAQHRKQYIEHPYDRRIGEQLEVSLFGKRRDGTEFPAEVSLSPVNSDEGFFVVSAIRDITTRLREEQKLTELLEASPDAMVVIAADGNIVLINSQTEKLFGYTRNELIGNEIEMLMPMHYHDSHRSHRQKFVDMPQVRPMGAGITLFGKRKDGAEFPIEVSLSPVQSPEGLLISSSIRDITAHIEAERELNDAKEIAEAATLMKTRFLAAASHDLRQPMQALRLYLSALMERRDSESEFVDISQKMQLSLDAVSGLLDALLDISKFEGGSIVPNIQDIRIQDFLDRIVADNAQQASEKGLVLECSSANCVVRSDAGLLERIVDNLVTNAIRYTNEGRVTINCSCGNEHAQVSVSDTGIGIPQSEIDTIFDEYYQLENTVRDRRKGLGLGLSIVKHIARLLDIKLSVSSVLGKGSTFTVELPLGDAARLPVATSVSNGSPQLRGIKSPVVLFVDDDPAIIDATTMFLRASNIEVHTALSGDEALAKLNSGIRPDIFITDYRLPNYNGIELVRRMKLKTSAELPTVIMTGDTSSKEIAEANLTNCTVLHKPIDTAKLLVLIDELAR